MTTLELAELGTSTWGRGWSMRIAEGLGVAERTVRRWNAGANIPDGAAADIRALANRYVAEQAERRLAADAVAQAVHVPARSILQPYVRDGLEAAARGVVASTTELVRQELGGDMARRILRDALQTLEV
jgi:hypothetical protein